jgi:hypothetical protein
MDRALTERERAVLTTLVAAADSPTLLAQLPNARVTGACGCGCPTISFSGSDEPGGIEVVADAEASDASGAILLFVSATGQLASLEYAWVTDAPPTEFPAAESLIKARKT